MWHNFLSPVTEKLAKHNLAHRESNAVVRRITIIPGIAVLVLMVLVGWQVGSWELSNMNLQEEMQDLASQAGTHVGFVPPSSDEEVSRAIIRRAKEHGIELNPTQVTVRRTNPGEKTSTLYLAADYTVPVNLAFFSFKLHFAPSSDKPGM
jgi:hypothetical protein